LTAIGATVASTPRPQADATADSTVAPAAVEGAPAEAVAQPDGSSELDSYKQRMEMEKAEKEEGGFK
jgi:hypothetical protein